MAQLEIAFAVVSVAAVVAVAYLLHTCARTGAPTLEVPARPTEESAGATAATGVVVAEAEAAGLDEAAIKALPMLVVHGGGGREEEAASSAAASCAVCLGEYSRGDVLRVLPGCAHDFHRHCVDQWLRLHPSCPVCRTPPSAPAPGQL